MVSPKRKREGVGFIREKFQKLSIRSACKILGLHQSTYFHKPKKVRSDEELRAKIAEIAQDKSQYGRPMITWRLRYRHGFKDNHKRIARIYREMELQIGKRVRKKKRSERRFMFVAPKKPNELWAMDFVMDSFANGRRFRVLTVKDLCTHEAIVLHVDRSIGGHDVAEALEEVCKKRGAPIAIICDNGPEFISRALDEWAEKRNVRLQFIQPGKPIQNAFIESFNGKIRRECLEQNWFENLDEAKRIIEDWRIEYNTDRPTRPLGNKTPTEFAREFGVAL